MKNALAAGMLVLGSLGLAAAATAAPPPPVQLAQAAGQGAQVFRTNCASCHGNSGEGVPGLAPALKGNEWVQQASPEQIAETVRQGRAGANKRYANQFPAPMPPFPQIKGEQLEALIQYVKETLAAGG